jgi:hypothetical protein
MTTTTPMTIRVQAKGGKFSADDIGGAEALGGRGIARVTRLDGVAKCTQTLDAVLPTGE